MAKPNFFKRRAKQEGIEEEVLIENLLTVHVHKTSAIADDLGISPEAVSMYLNAHGYKNVCRWVRVADHSNSRSEPHNDVVTEGVPSMTAARPEDR